MCPVGRGPLTSRVYPTEGRCHSTESVLCVQLTSLHLYRLCRTLRNGLQRETGVKGTAALPQLSRSLSVGWWSKPKASEQPWAGEQKHVCLSGLGQGWEGTGCTAGGDWAAAVGCPRVPPPPPGRHHGEKGPQTDSRDTHLRTPLGPCPAKHRETGKEGTKVNW